MISGFFFFWAVVGQTQKHGLPGIPQKQIKIEKLNLVGANFSQMKKAMVDWYCNGTDHSTTAPCRLRLLSKNIKYKSEDSVFSDFETQAMADKKDVIREFANMFKLFCAPPSLGKKYYDQTCANTLLKTKYGMPLG
jgi:hypothetical protein